ncbi:MAG: hypothetical protein ACTSQY_08640 [Candidatus Odinarchaeia archaeon]
MAIAAIVWIGSTLYVVRYYLKNKNIMTKSVLIFNVAFGVGLIMLLFETQVSLASATAATFNFIYTTLGLIGVLFLWYGLLIVIKENVKAKLIFVLLAAFIPLKIIDYIDWTMTKIEFSSTAIMITAIIYFIAVIGLIITASYIIKSTKIRFLKTKMALIVVAGVILLIELFFIATPGIFYSLRLIVASFLVIPLAVVSSFAVTYKVKDFVNLLGLEHWHAVKISKNDERITALLWRYTSPPNSCEYYDKTLKSKCKLDPNSYRLFDCQGIKYREGTICPIIYSKGREHRD